MPSDIVFNYVDDPKEADTLFHLAEIIWREHYTPIIGSAQVDYMLSHIHSPDTIRSELQDEHVQYFMIWRGNTAVGYICVKFEDAKLFLSKIYVVSSERGSGIGRLAIDRVKQIAQQHGLDVIRLTVNRDNSDTIAAYERMGFAVTGELCADIGGGYVMDDYLMEMSI